jgi:hypothetical protein
MADEKKFPTEVIDLPSKGKLYPAGHPLRSGQIELKYMTAKEEDILTSTNLIQKGIVLDKLFESLIVTPGVKVEDILSGDLNAIMVASRILGYGKDYDAEVECPECGAEQEASCDLSLLQDTEGATDIQRTEDGNFQVTLPASKKTVVFKVLTRGEEVGMQKEVEALRKLNKNLNRDTTTFLRYIIKSVNGDTEKMPIIDFVENMLVKDSKFLREEYKRAMPNVNFEFELTCESCSETSTVRLPVGTKFFWPDSGV